MSSFNGDKFVYRECEHKVNSQKWRLIKTKKMCWCQALCSGVGDEGQDGKGAQPPPPHHRVGGLNNLWAPQNVLRPYTIIHIMGAQTLSTFLYNSYINVYMRHHA